MKRRIAAVLSFVLALSSMSTLVLGSTAGATGLGDGLEPDTSDNGSYVPPELEAADDSEPGFEPLPSESATSDGTAPEDGVETNETGTPTDDDIPEDAKPQQTVCGTAPTTMQHQPGSCSSPYDPPPNIQPVCSWKLFEVFKFIWKTIKRPIYTFVQVMLPGTNIPDPNASPIRVITGYSTERVRERVVEASHEWWCRNSSD